jgi:hypothetical protein
MEIKSLLDLDSFFCLGVEERRREEIDWFDSIRFD